MMEEIAVLEIKCPRCQEVWEVSPHKWRNLNSIINNGKKKLHCPFCNKLVELDEYQTEMMLRIRQGMPIIPELQWYRKEMKRLGEK